MNDEICRIDPNFYELNEDKRRKDFLKGYKQFYAKLHPNLDYLKSTEFKAYCELLYIYKMILHTMIEIRDFKATERDLGL